MQAKDDTQSANIQKYLKQSYHVKFWVHNLEIQTTFPSCADTCLQNIEIHELKCHCNNLKST